MKAPVSAWSNRSDRIEVYASGQNECSLLGSFSLTKSIVLDIYFNIATYQELFFVQLLQTRPLFQY